MHCFDDMKFYLALNIIFLCVCRTQMFRQYDYNVVHHHVELSYIDKNIIEGTLKNVKPNRTYRAYSVDAVLKRKLYGDSFKAGVHTFYFLSNEYKNSGIKFDIKMCEALEKNLFGLRNALQSANLNGTLKCPFKPGRYALHNYNVPDEYLPPNVPEGDFMLKFVAFLDNNVFAEIRWFGGVRYKIKKKGTF